ncbi:hypothetical protein NKH77_30060 [Streptomyces sp. M19]
MRRWGTALAAVVLAGAGLMGVTTAAGAASAPTAACATGWGSGVKSHEPAEYKALDTIRTGTHDCFDRMVFDVGGADTGAIGYHVGYVDAFHQDGSGRPIPVDGGAILEVRVGAPSHDPRATRSRTRSCGPALPGVDVTDYRTFRDTRFGASFEGDTQVGLGVRARLPFRVFQSGEHLIVDVAHSWNA